MMKVLVYLVVLLQATIWAEKVRFDGYSVVRVFPVKPEHVAFLKDLEENPKYEELELDFWKSPGSVGVSVDIMVGPSHESRLTTMLYRHHLIYSTMVDDVQSRIDAEALELSKKTPGLLVDFNNYNRFDEINTWLKDIVNECPPDMYCETDVIGQSEEGRDLTVIKLGGAVRKPIIYLECGIHAREWVAPAVCINIANRLITQPGNPDVQAMLSQYDWYIEPSSNPDGYEYTHTDNRMWRKTRRLNSDVGSTCYGTDPNRNFDFHWGESGTSTNPCSDIYLGSAAFSEKEADAIRNYVRNFNDNVRAYFAVHSYGQYFLIPWSYAGGQYPPDFDDMKHIGDVGAAAILAQSGLTYRVGQSADLLGATAGCSDDWAKGSMGIKFAYTIELRDTGSYGFALPAAQIQPNFEEVWDSLREISKTLDAEFPMP